MIASPDLPLDDLMPWLFALWAACGVGAFLFFRRSRNARHKRALWNGLMIGGNAVFIGVAWLAGAPGYFIALAAVVAVIGARRSMAMTRFCDACGGNHFPMDGQPQDACRHCGASLQAGRPPTVR